MAIGYGQLIAAKSVVECHPNNGHSNSFKSVYKDHGTKLKTIISIDCLDNRRRRVYAKTDGYGYILYVNMGGQRLVLTHPITLLALAITDLKALVIGGKS